MSAPLTMSDPKPRLAASFSLGETSAYMTARLLGDPEFREQFSEIKVVTANTSREDEKALAFGNRCDLHFGFDMVWLEAVVHHGEAKGCTHRVVTYETAARDGSVFEEVIKKYGIPNQQYPHCTRELKLNPIRSYLENELGWERGSYLTAVGIRADEIDRMSEAAMATGVIYPLVKLGVTKPHINEWFAKQPFRIDLEGFEDNCHGCQKKSLRKLLTLAQRDPSQFDWNRRIEAEYGYVGGEFNKEPGPGQTPLAADYRRVFYRDNRSTDDLFALYDQVKDTFVPATNDRLEIPQPNLFPIDLDIPGGCGESCEIWTDNWDEAA